MKKGIVALLTLLLVFVCVSSTVADTIRIKEGYKPNIRLKPSTDAKILRQAKPGEKFELLGSSGTWYRIRLGYNMFGWIAGGMVEVIESDTTKKPSTTPIKATAKKTATPNVTPNNTIEVQVLYIHQDTQKSLISTKVVLEKDKTSSVYANKSLFIDKYELVGSSSIVVNVSSGGIPTPAVLRFYLKDKSKNTDTTVPKSTLTPGLTATPSNKVNKQNNTWICPNCNTECWANYCPNCGTKRPEIAPSEGTEKQVLTTQPRITPAPTKKPTPEKTATPRPTAKGTVMPKSTSKTVGNIGFGEINDWFGQKIEVVGQYVERLGYTPNPNNKTGVFKNIYWEFTSSSNEPYAIIVWFNTEGRDVNWVSFEYHKDSARLGEIRQSLTLLLGNPTYQKYKEEINDGYKTVTAEALSWQGNGMYYLIGFANKADGSRGTMADAENGKTGFTVTIMRHESSDSNKATATPKKVTTKKPTVTQEPVKIEVSIESVNIKDTRYGTRQFYIRFRNNSSVAIDRIDFHIQGYNRYGDRIKQYNMDTIAFYTDEIINPGKLSPKDVYY